MIYNMEEHENMNTIKQTKIYGTDSKYPGMDIIMSDGTIFFMTDNEIENLMKLARTSKHSTSDLLFLPSGLTTSLVKKVTQ